MKFTRGDKLLAIGFITGMVIFMGIAFAAVPDITVNYPANHTYTGNLTYTVNITFTDPDAADVGTWVGTVYLNETNVTYNNSVQNNTLTNFTIPTQANGRYMLWVRVSDATDSGVSLNYSFIINRRAAFNGTAEIVSTFKTFFEDEIGGSLVIAAIILIIILTLFAVKFGLDLRIFAAVILLPLFILLGQYGYLGSAGWLTGLGLIALGFLILLAIYKIFQKE